MFFVKVDVGRFSHASTFCMRIWVASTITLKCIMLSMFAMYIIHLMCMVVGFGHVCFGTSQVKFCNKDSILDIHVSYTV